MSEQAKVLAGRLAYLQFNYGDHHPMTVAAMRGDAAGFRSAARHITENEDCGVVQLLGDLAKFGGAP